MTDLEYDISVRLRDVLKKLLEERREYTTGPEVLRAIRPKHLRSSAQRGSPFRRALRSAIAEEVCARRLTLDFQHDPPRLHVTEAGAQFFLSSGLHATRTPRPQVKLTQPSLREMAIGEYAAAAAAVKEIVDRLTGHPYISVGELFVERLPGTIRSLLDREQYLQGENGDLANQVYNVGWDVDMLRASLP
ncbi:hypothetical protein GY45DRAFT_1376240 [Cubamyces sp. BRFM 1775]|nr:hypothetical protein GY45DRAFT_1376240 [Cubamyces sp. BRFM 1775]